MAQLSCQNLTLGYDGKIVISDLNFQVHKGDYLCIVGENGSGKSTLMKAILRLKAPIEGQIQLGDGVRDNQIGYLPQQTSIQKDFPATVSEVVHSGCLNQMGIRPFYGKAEKERAKGNMKRLGIWDLAKKCYRELSGGQQQRVLLARALCATETVLLLDEPVAGLDPGATTEMYDLIDELNKSGITIIMISHDIQSAIRHSSKVLHLGNGGSLYFGETKEYEKSEVGQLYARIRGFSDD